MLYTCCVNIEQLFNTAVCLLLSEGFLCAAQQVCDWCVFSDMPDINYGGWEFYVLLTGV